MFPIGRKDTGAKEIHIWLHRKLLDDLRFKIYIQKKEEKSHNQK